MKLRILLLAPLAVACQANTMRWHHDSTGAVMVGAMAGSQIGTPAFELGLSGGREPNDSNAPAPIFGGQAESDVHAETSAGVHAEMFVTHNLSLGLGYEQLSFDPEPMNLGGIGQPLDVSAHDVNRFLLTGRLWSDPFGPHKRTRLWLGGNFGYSHNVETTGTIRTPNQGGAGLHDSSFSYKGTDILSAGVSVGASILVVRNLVFDLGVGYESSLDTSSGNMRFTNGSADADSSVFLYDADTDYEALTLGFRLSWLF
jgi:hypothetical protein